MRAKMKELREKKGLTQHQMANEIDVSRPTYVNIERGNANPSLPVAMKIKQVLEYKSDDIFLNKNV